VVGELRVEGVRYLDPSRVQAISGLTVGEPLWTADLDRARQALLLDSRIAAAQVSRRFPRGLRIVVRERVPALLVDHGTPWELDSTGVLLTPLDRGVVADVPLLVGPKFEGVPAGTHVASAEVARGLKWAGTLADQTLQLAGQVSELDVSHAEITTLTLLDGTRVLAAAWPPSERTLSALRVVLADLKQKGTSADEVDVRFENQVIVRPSAQRSAEDHQG
jgi:cell division protein FtsQ